MRDDVATFPVPVLIDSREQLPYSFTGLHTDAKDGGRPLLVPVKTVALSTGDYTLEGLDNEIAVERKSLADLFSTLGQGRERFEAELERLDARDFAAVVVEASWEQVLLRPPERSRLNPKTVFRSVVAWQQRYRWVHWWFTGDRRLGEVATLRILERYWRDRQRGA